LIGSGILGLVAVLSQAVPETVRIRKTDFPRFAGVVACGEAPEDSCPGASAGFVLAGLAGDSAIPDPAAPELAAGGRIVLGFLEGKPFTWPRYSVEYPNSGFKWVVLNELSLNERNRVFLTLWRHTGTSLDLMKIFPRMLPLALGETTVHAKAPLPDGSLLLVLKGEGTDAGIRLQDYRFLRLAAPDRMSEAYRRTHRSEIPIQDILERINADEPVEAVVDSALACEVSRRKAPSGGPLVRFTVSRTRVLHTKEGPRETPEGKSFQEIDIYRIIKSAKP
jgi:hypothetical protein